MAVIPSKLQLVLCTWKDAWCDATESVGVTDAHLRHKASIQQTLGWLLYQDEEGVSIANEYCPEDETYRGRTFILRTMLISIEPYTLSKPRSIKKVPHAKAAAGQVPPPPSTG